MDDLELCEDGFHSDECPGCGLTADERDDPANATNAAMNFGDGVAAERARIAAEVRGLNCHCSGSFATGHSERCPILAVLAIVEGTP